MPLAVTTSRDASAQGLARARSRAAAWGLPFVPRARRPIEELLAREAEALIVFARGATELHNRQGQLRFSPGMAALRLKRLQTRDQANPDRVVAAAEVQEGDAILDCTAGLGQDALVLARAAGPTGRVVALEASLPLYAVVSEGVRLEEPDGRSARLEVLHQEASEFLRAQPDGSFDVVYFDPMFERPRRANPAFELLRRHAAPMPLPPEVLAQARRVARRWVVVKAARHSEGLRALGLQPLEGSRYADVVFARAGPTAR